MHRNLLRTSLAAACGASLLAVAACSNSSSTTGVAASATSSATTAGSSASPSATTGGKPLVLGTSGDFPPLSYKGSSGAIVGFEDDMMKSIGASLGRTVTWQQFDFSGLIPALQSGRIDAVVSGLYDTAERAKVVDIIDYMQIPLGVMTLKENAAKTTSATDLCGKSVAYILGSPPELAQVQAWSTACTSAGKAAVTATGYKSVSAAVADIVNGRTYAELEGDITVLYVSQTQYGDKLGVGFNVAGQTSKVGIAVAKGSQLATDLKPAVAAWMASPAYCTDVTQWKLSAGDLLQPCP